MDIVDITTRSRMMAGILSRNTKPEMIVRRYLHGFGYRYRLHRKDLPGKPDLVLPKYKLAIFVHGCFWHRHSGCMYATTPSSREDFWSDKLNKNAIRDRNQIASLSSDGWRVIVVWECGLKHLLNEIHILRDMIENSNEVFQVWPAKPPRAKS